ncbi:MAG: GNAT family N-acetyltransferase [Bacteroidia bacterium]
MRYLSSDKNRKLKIFPLDKSRWNDLEKLFGERGACGGCWCMTWRLKSSDYEKMKGKKNKNTFRKIVYAGEPAGVIGYLNNLPVSWCAVAPREKFIRLENSRVLKRVDEKRVWSVTCFFIDKRYRRKGLLVEMLKGVIDYCKTQKAKIVEAYPVEPKKNPMPDVFAWTGIVPAFIKAGFKEAARHSPTRPIMRYYL